MLVDGFMFYNELDILELRFGLLDEYVDKFILVETEVTHVGTHKELFFEKNKDRYAKWLHKITHVILRADECPTDPNPWCREKHHRNGILRGMDEAGVPNDAIMMISDVDEIPDMTKIPFEPLPHVVNAVHMWMFEYSLDYLFTGEPWFGTVIANAELIRRSGPNYFRDNRWKFPPIVYAGWHLSSFGNPKHVLNKMHTFAHAKDGHHATQTIETFETFISEGIHTDGKTKLLPRPSEVPLPGSIDTLRRLKLGTFVDTASCVL